MPESAFLSFEAGGEQGRERGGEQCKLYACFSWSVADVARSFCSVYDWDGPGVIGRRLREDQLVSFAFVNKHVSSPLPHEIVAIIAGGVLRSSCMDQQDDWMLVRPDVTGERDVFLPEQKMPRDLQVGERLELNLGDFVIHLKVASIREVGAKSLDVSAWLDGCQQQASTPQSPWCRQGQEIHCFSTVADKKTAVSSYRPGVGFASNGSVIVQVFDDEAILFNLKGDILHRFEGRWAGPVAMGRHSLVLACSGHPSKIYGYLLSNFKLICEHDIDGTGEIVGLGVRASSVAKSLSEQYHAVYVNGTQRDFRLYFSGVGPSIGPWRTFYDPLRPGFRPVFHDAKLWSNRVLIWEDDEGLLALLHKPTPAAMGCLVEQACSPDEEHFYDAKTYSKCSSCPPWTLLSGKDAKKHRQLLGSICFTAGIAINSSRVARAGYLKDSDRAVVFLYSHFDFSTPREIICGIPGEKNRRGDGPLMGLEFVDDNTLAFLFDTQPEAILVDFALKRTRM